VLWFLFIRGSAILDNLEANVAVPTFPNPIYVKRQQDRHGCVDEAAWAMALAKAGITKTPTSAEEARKLFVRARKKYWAARLACALPGEFNLYNQRRMREDLAPIGPDGFSMEIEHCAELSREPGRALDPTNLWEISRRQHDFRHGNVPVRWHMGSFPRSPHAANLPSKFGNPLDYAVWP
jgi:hypothetical protein